MSTSRRGGADLPVPRDDAVRRRMRRQSRRDTAAEMAIRRSLHATGLRYRVDYRLEPTLRCRADVVFTRAKVAVFIDGCFWHGCQLHATRPTNNAAWWRAKIADNVARDRRNSAALVELGWNVLRFWEHEDPEAVVATVVRAVRAARKA